MFRGALHCAIALSFCNPFVVIGISPAPTNAANFAVRKVTDFGDALNGSQAVPFGVVDDHLLFAAVENGRGGIYRTNGTEVQRIEGSILDQGKWSPPHSAVQFGDELYFVMGAPAAGGIELYASDGTTLRQVADLAPGESNSYPSNLRVVNDRLLFNAVTEAAAPGGTPIRLLSTDGNTIDQFPISDFAPAGSALLNDRLVFLGIPPGGGVGELYSTDGQSILPIETPTVSSELGAFAIQRIGDSAYIHTKENDESSIYRTDGNTAEKIVSLNAFLPHQGRVAGIFPLDGSLHFAIHDEANNEFVFYQEKGNAFVETLRQTVPPDLEWHDPQYESPFQTNQGQAFFLPTYFPSMEGGVYVYNGESFEEKIPVADGFDVSGFQELGGRLLVNLQGGPNEALLEFVDGNAIEAGPRVAELTMFEQSIFGVSQDLLTLSLQFLQPESHQLQTLLTWTDTDKPSPFIEFKGQLYFRGGNGRNTQLYAIVPVPEPTSLAVIAAGLLMCGVTARRQRRSI